jgi:mannose-P-dolichol utilization defect protein 1
LESVGYCTNLAYNYRNKNPFSTYGETVLVNVQNAVIIFLILSYGRHHALLVLTMIVMTAFQVGLLNEKWVDAGSMKYFQAATIPISILSKIPQILINYK